MKKRALLSVLGLSLCLFLMAGVPHKFYLSVLNVEFNREEKTLQMTLKTFADDLQRAIQERFHNEIEIPAEGKLSPDLTKKIDAYLREHISISIDDRAFAIHYLGSEADWDDVYHYLEVEKISLDSIQKVTLKNSLFMEVFPRQKNVVHFKLEDTKKTLIMLGDQHKKSFQLDKK